VPRDPLPQGQFARARAFRAVATELQSTELPRDAQDERAILAHIVGVTEALLRRRLAGCDPAAIAEIAGALNAAHAAYWRYRHELTFALSAPWAADWQADAMEGNDPAARLRPLELLLEFLVLSPPSGDHRPDRYEITELEQLAHMLLENRTRLNALDVGLGYAAPEDPPDRAAQDDGLSPDAGTLADLTMRFNFAAYLEASARDRTRIRMPAPDNTAPPAARPTSGTRSESASPGLPTRRTPGVFRPIASFDPPQHMMSTDALMRAHLGTGLDGIRAVLGTAVDWTSDAAVAVTEPQTLAQAAEEWSGLPRAEVDAAVILLSLNTRNLHDEASRYWEVERRSQRLRVRPLPGHRHKNVDHALGRGSNPGAIHRLLPGLATALFRPGPSALSSDRHAATPLETEPATGSRGRSRRFGLGDAIRRNEALVFRVAPTTAFGFGKGTPFSQTRWGFSKSP
jgi:hypothetical protein